MIGRVLVPLDGSPLAEAALPYARALAAASGEELVLVNVVAPIAAAVSPTHQKFLEEHRAQAETAGRRYLEEKAAQLGAAGLRVQPVVLSGPVAATLQQYATAEGIGLIALATHGRSGLERWMVGSVAAQLIHGSTIPVLVFRPRHGAEAGPPLVRILVGLDGSALAEAALPYAATLAQRLKLPVTLTRVVSSEVELFGGPDYLDIPGDIVAEVRATAGEYLDQHAKKLKAEGILCETKVDVGFPVTQIIGEANRHPGTLILISSHGQSGLGRSLLGNVADRVIHESSWPVLVVRAQPTGG